LAEQAIPSVTLPGRDEEASQASFGRCPLEKLFAQIMSLKRPAAHGLMQDANSRPESQDDNATPRCSIRCQADESGLAPYWLPFTANRAFKRHPRLIERAQGMHYFTPDGRKLLDAMSGLWCCNAGHCRAPIVEAIRQQAARLDYAPAFQEGHVAAFQLAARLAKLAPTDLTRVFFCNSGSEAVDTALKIALAYHKLSG
jgi:beta-alanine--pyruvate transaminase